MDRLEWYHHALAMAMLIDELLTYLFDGQPHLLTANMATWLAASRRFTAFVNTHHTKIRKKIRIAQGTENIRDLQLELETAYLLLRERSLNLAYEPQHPELGRSPDFAVTFTTSLTFMVEVTRLRSTGSRISSSTEEQTDKVLLGEGFSDMVCSKLGQLPPKLSNLLLVGIEAWELTQIHLHAAMLRIQKRAENKDPNIVRKHGFRDRADFFNHYQRLSALLVRDIPLESDKPVVIWENPQAKFPLPARVRTAVLRTHSL